MITLPTCKIALTILADTIFYLMSIFFARIQVMEFRINNDLIVSQTDTVIFTVSTPFPRNAIIIIQSRNDCSVYIPLFVSGNSRNCFDATLD